MAFVVCSRGGGVFVGGVAVVVGVVVFVASGVDVGVVGVVFVVSGGV